MTKSHSKLRDDQLEIKNKLRGLLKEHRSVLLVAATGWGKTELMIDILGSATKEVWFVVHRKRLFKDVVKRFAVLDPGYIASGYKYVAGKRLYICMAKSLSSRLAKLQHPSMVVFDEAHNCGSATYEALMADNYRVLLTATPERTDGQGLGKYANVMLEAMPMDQLIQNKLLSNYKYYAPSAIDDSQLKSRAGEFTPESIDKVYQPIVGDCVESYKKYAYGKRAVVFAHSIKASQEIAARFNAAGISAASLESTLKDDEADDISDSFKSNNLLVICSVNMVLEGYDVPGIKCIIWARPTKSIVVKKQGDGRGLRYIEDEICFILDHVNNYKRHGLPDDHIEWSLEGKAKRPARSIAVRECMNCKACYKPAACCPECGFSNPVKERVIKKTKGELEEIKRENKERRKQDIKDIKTLDGLKEYARIKGYKYGWVIRYAKFKRLV